MNVAQELLEHKTLMIAVLSSARAIAAELGVDMTMSVAEMSRELGANRTSAYAQRDRLIQALTDLVSAGPGRPAGQSDGEEGGRCEEMALTIRVLEYRTRRLDAVVEHANRTEYSPSFRRLILEEYDRWAGSRADFAAACRLPLDTLKDWLREDRDGIPSSPPAKPQVAEPVDASEMTKAILQEYEKWEGSTKAFLGVTAQRHGLSTNQVRRVLTICGAIQPRPRRSFRYRGTTAHLSPGSLLVTDGKTLDIEFTGSGSRLRLNWQGIVDQATACDTAVVVTEAEDSAGVLRAFRDSLKYMGGVAPIGLLHDNKPCYEEANLRRIITAAGTGLVPATVGRPENKAILEGAFSLFEDRVGTIRLDDTSQESLIRSAVTEIVRGYTSATNRVPRAELGGLSREGALRTTLPSQAEKAADEAFIKNLKARHERQQLPDWHRRKKPASRRLLDQVFARLGLEELDPSGKLREYLSIYEPAAIRLATAVVEPRLERDELNRDYAHRYFTKVTQAKQHELDLERQSALLLELCRAQNQDWITEERTEYAALKRDRDPEALARALAERAASAGLPVQGTYWTVKLLELLDNAPELLGLVKRFLVRLYEAPEDRRLYLLDRLAAHHCGIA